MKYSEICKAGQIKLAKKRRNNKLLRMGLLVLLVLIPLTFYFSGAFNPGMD